jgi:hypothetical protein
MIEGARIPVATRLYEVRLCSSVGDIVLVTSGAVEVTVVVAVTPGTASLHAELMMLAGKVFNGRGAWNGADRRCIGLVV